MTQFCLLLLVEEKYRLWGCIEEKLEGKTVESLNSNWPYFS